MFRALRLTLVLGLLVAMPGLAGAQTFVNRDVNLRAGPDRVFPVVTWLRAGTRVRVFGCTSGWRWCDVASGRHRSWLSSAFLSSWSQRGTPIVTWSIGPYWDMHYRGQPWFGSRSQWDAWGSPAWRPPPPPPRGRW